MCLHTSKGLRKAFEVAAEMRAARMTPTAIAFSALLEACHNAGNIGKGAEVELRWRPPGSAERHDRHRTLITACELATQ